MSQTPGVVKKHCTKTISLLLSVKPQVPKPPTIQKENNTDKGHPARAGFLSCGITQSLALPLLSFTILSVKLRRLMVSQPSLVCRDPEWITGSKSTFEARGRRFESRHVKLATVRLDVRRNRTSNLASKFESKNHRSAIVSGEC